MALAIAAFNGNCCWHYSNREMPRISRGKNGFSLMPSLRNGRNILLKNNRGIRVMSPETSSPSFKVDQFLDAWDDEYGGIIIDPNNLPSSVNAFASALRASLSNWKLKGKKGIWLKILLEQADFIPIAIQVLVVKEKCPCSCSGVWKMPTGYINKFEDIFSGVIREVKEETGVDTIFLKLVAFRHAHRVAFDKSDILFVCVLKPLSYEITVDEKELQAAKWMALDEYMEQPFYEEDHMSRRVIDACIAAHDDHYNGFVAHQLTSKLDGKLSYLYYDSSSTF
ncbi:nudix hydrolase 8 isoform X2 [Jatropha curcas]|uniref:nudix hydrolase 8 isoform X2 n=1 Tax=Jatropha curcas TaxID=180498 RepID=UPI0005FAED58|nr:nudix hydrolase 8 isoform X2 [Jatropha curcas]